MTRIRTLCLALAAALAAVPAAGCGGSKQEDKQPKLQGAPDPRIKGPAQPGGAGSSTL